MPGQHNDGSIILDTRIDNSGAMIGIKKLHELVDRFHNAVRNVGATVQQSSAKAVSSMQDASAAYGRAAANATQTAKAVKQVNAAIAKTQKQIIAAEGKLAEYYAEVDAIKASTDESLKQTTSDDQAAHLLEIEDIQIQQLNEKYATQLQQLEMLEKQLADYQAKAAEFDTISEPAEQSEESLKGVDEELKQKSEDAEDAAGGMSFLGNAFRSLASTAARAAVSLARFTGRAVVNGIKSLWQHTQKAAKAFLTLGKRAKKANGGLGASFKTLLKYGLGIRSLYALFNKLRGAVKEGFSHLAQYSDEVNQSISSVLSALTKLKNQLAASFAPLVEIAAPILNQLIGGLTTATEKLGQLVAALSGKKTFIKAADVQEDYAKSLDKTSKSAKEAKKQLAGFDELEILKDDTKDDGKTDPADMFTEEEVPEDIENLADDIKETLEGTDWSGIGRSIGDKLKFALDSIPWDEIKAKAYNLGVRLATLLNGVLETPGLFYTVGKTLAEAINTAFSFLDGFAWNFHWDSLGTAIMDTVEGICDNLDWRLINHAVQGLAQGFAELVNTVFARRETWEKLGETVGNGINTIVSGALTLIRNIDFLQIGTTIAAALNRAIQTIKWDDLGKLFAEYIAALFETVYGFATEFDWAEFAKRLVSGINAFWSTLRERLAALDWREVGQGLADGLNRFILGINWSNMAGTISDAIKGFLDMVFAFLANVNWQAIGDAIADFILGIDWIGIVGRLLEIGAMLIAGLLQGMFQAVARIGIWIKENIIDPIIEWFRNLFGIHSPSTVMAEIGGYLIAGLLEGMLNGVKTIGKWLKKNIVQPIQKFFKDPIGTIKLAVDESWTATQEVWESVKDSEVVKTIAGYVRNTFDSAKAAFDTLTSGSVVKSVSGFVDSSFDAAKTIFNNFKDGDVYKRVKGLVDSAFHNAKATFDAFKDGDVYKHVKGVVENAFNAAKGTFDAFVDGSVFKHICGVIESTYTNARDTFDAFVDKDVFKHIKGVVENVFNTTKAVFDAFVDGDVWKHIKGVVENVFNTTKNVFDAFVDGDVWKHVRGVIENTYNTVKATFDAFKDGSTYKTIKGLVDSTFTSVQNTFNSLADTPVYKTIKASVEKFGTWIADAWTAAQMATSSVTRTVYAALQKASTWVSDAWTVVSTAGQTFTTTLSVALSKSGWTTIANWVGTAVSVAVSLAKSGWTTIARYVGSAVTATISLAKNGWSSISDYVGTAVTTKISLAKNNWNSFIQWLTGATNGVVSVSISLIKSGWSSIKSFFGLADGGMLGANGGVKMFASGGMITSSGVMRDIVSKVNAYAGGTAHAHGSLFLAGEAGPEIVGHVNGRTEVLNRSQIASAIYSAVLEGMESAVNGLGAYIGQRMIDCTNAVIAGMLTIANASEALPVKIVGGDATLMKQLGALTSGITYTAPAYSTGTILPYELQAEIRRSTAELRAAIESAAEEIIQTIIAAAGSQTSSLSSAFEAALREYANRGGYDPASFTQYAIDEINRRTQAMGVSPLLG